MPRLIPLLLVSLLACSGKPGDRAVPSETPADGKKTALPEGLRSPLLDEMRARRIVIRDATRWTPKQYTELLRAREAEAVGAFRLLRAKLGTLRGFAAEFESEPGFRKLVLTSEGYRKFIFLLSQDARNYFESRGAPAKFVFELRDLKGKPLFDEDGVLSQHGIEIYTRVRRRLPAFWRHPDGRVNGNVRPSADLLAQRRPPSGAPYAPPAPSRGQLPPPPGSPGSGASAIPPPPPGAAGDGAAALALLAELVRSGYVEISEEELGLLLAAGKTTEKRLSEESSLRIVRAGDKKFYLISPSDPLMAIVAKHRSGGGANQ